MQPRALLHAVVAGLFRRGWLVATVAVLACAAFAAAAVTSIVEATYLGPSATSPSVAPVVAAQARPSPPRHRSDGGALVARNMFCSTCAPTATGADPTDGPSFAPPAVLIATSIGRQPRATLRATTTDAQGSYGVGDVVPGVGTVERIGYASVAIYDTRSRRRGTLWLDQNRATGRGELGAATPAATAEPWDGRIRKLDDHTFEVDRALVRELVSAGARPNGVRVAPVTDHGALVGLKLNGVQPTSIAGALGLRSGDTLQAINNTRIESLQTLIDLYAKLDQLNNVQLDGTRGDQPLTIELRMR